MSDQKDQPATSNEISDQYVQMFEAIMDITREKNRVRDIERYGVQTAERVQAVTVAVTVLATILAEHKYFKGDAVEKVVPEYMHGREFYFITHRSNDEIADDRFLTALGFSVADARRDSIEVDGVMVVVTEFQIELPQDWMI